MCTTTTTTTTTRDRGDRYGPMERARLELLEYLKQLERVFDHKTARPAQLYGNRPTGRLGCRGELIETPAAKLR